MYSRLSLGALGMKTQESVNPRNVPRKVTAPKTASTKKNLDPVADFLEGGDLKVEISLNTKVKSVPRKLPEKKPQSAMAQTKRRTVAPVNRASRMIAAMAEKYNGKVPESPASPDPYQSNLKSGANGKRAGSVSGLVPKNR